MKKHLLVLATAVVMGMSLVSCSAFGVVGAVYTGTTVPHSVTDNKLGTKVGSVEMIQTLAIFKTSPNTGLVFLQELRLKLTLTVTGNRHIYISEAGAKRLFAVTIATVIGFFALVVVLAVTEFLIKLRIKAVFHEFCYRILEQILDICHAADVDFL